MCIRDRYEALCDAMEADISSYGTDNHYVWTDLLAYLAAINGNDFSNYNKNKLNTLIQRLSSGESMEAVSYTHLDVYKRQA